MLKRGIACSLPWDGSNAHSGRQDARPLRQAGRPTPQPVDSGHLVWMIDPISGRSPSRYGLVHRVIPGESETWMIDRKSTRLNSSHLVISYAVFCLKKKKRNNYIKRMQQ